MNEIIETVKAHYRHSVERLHHIYGVRDTALKLGKPLGCDPDHIRLAAYLHDITKPLPREDHIALIKAYYDDFVLKAFTEPLWHAYSAAAFARTHFNITDENILKAIESHTVGRPAMTNLEKVIFVADYIEPSRMFPKSVEIRAIAFQDFERAVYEIINASIQFHETFGDFVPKVAYEAKAYYKKRR